MRLILFNIIVLLGSVLSLLWLLMHFEPTLLMDALLFIANAVMCTSAFWLYAQLNINDRPFSKYNVNPFAKNIDFDTKYTNTFSANQSVFQSEPDTNQFQQASTSSKRFLIIFILLIILSVSLKFDIFNQVSSITLNIMVFIVFLAVCLGAVVCFVLYKSINKNTISQTPAPMLTDQLQNPDNDYQFTDVQKSDDNTYVINYKQKTSSKKVQFKAVDSNKNNILEPNEIVNYRVIDKKP